MAISWGVIKVETNKYQIQNQPFNKGDTVNLPVYFDGLTFKE